MREWLAIRLLVLLGYLPLRINQWLGRTLGTLAWHLHLRERHVAQTNLALCFPDREPAWQERVARESLRHMGAALLESPRLWKLGRSAIDDLLDNPDALKDLLRVYAQGRGLIISAPHQGSWEYVGLLLAANTRMTTLFRPSRLPAVDDFVREGRADSGAILAPTDARGIRTLAKALSNNECIGMLPDQEPPLGNGIYAAFYGVPAYTMALLPRMASRYGTPVANVFAERLTNGRMRLHHRWADDAIRDSDIETACRAMNRDVEMLIAIAPEQYNWVYKRFREQPDGRNLYRRASS